MLRLLAPAIAKNFLGDAPAWYKLAIVAFLIVNPILWITAGPFVAGWLLVAEFIFTLAMALRCYPLLPGGLLALEAVAIGMTSPDSVYEETRNNLSVLLLLIFMVAGIYFMRDLLLVLFTRLLIGVRSKILLSATFLLAAAVLSAFLDALTVAAVVLAVATGFYAIYHRYASGRGAGQHHDHGDDDLIDAAHQADLEQFRSFLRSLVMHAAVGTAVGGVASLVGEPQNLLIGQLAGWDFGEFARRMAPISIPVAVLAVALTVVLERLRWFGYGAQLPTSVRAILRDADAQQRADRSPRARARLLVQAITAIALIVGLALHLAEVGLIGLAVIIVATTFSGVTSEHSIGKAFTEALPFTALLVTFFAVVSVIHDQNLFSPVIDAVLALDGRGQLLGIFGAAGALSAISDNVFVATVYITHVKDAFDAGAISRDQFEELAIAVNAGTNIPSVATPNGQAAFLFILTSALAPLIRLGYGRMMWMALPYTIVLTATTLIAMEVFLV
ncbi:sodium/proton antiporter NhaB [soil metagenome]